MSAERRELVDEIYTQLGELSDAVGGARELAASTLSDGWPEWGVYLFLEPGEYREDGRTPRVVRVGSHAYDASSQIGLWSRLAQHRGPVAGKLPGRGEHRGSGFRLQAGSALINRDGWPEAAASWGRTPVSEEERQAEIELEQAVSRYIGGMSVLWLDVPDRNHRMTLEFGLVGLLSNADREPIDPPSAGWLGHHARAAAVRDSGLWNVSLVYHHGIASVVELLTERVAATAKG